MRDEGQLIGIGLYTFPEAARLTNVGSRTIRRWVVGYDYKYTGETRHVSSVWSADHPSIVGTDGVSFFDLIEVRFVQAFRQEGITWPEIRRAAEEARSVFGTRHPFAAKRFSTDGRRIFLELAEHTGKKHLLELSRSQYAFDRIIRPTLRGVEFSNETAARWYPLFPKKHVVIDPARAFGRPIVDKYSIPTEVLAKAAFAEGSTRRTADLYDVDRDAVEAAIEFEERLAA